MKIEYSFTKRIPITRNRAFQRHLERKRAIFDVVHVPKGSWLGSGFSLFGAGANTVHLGRATVKLDDLLTKCEIHSVVEVSALFVYWCFTVKCSVSLV